MAFSQRRTPLFTSGRVAVALTKASAYPRTEQHLSHQSVKGGLLSAAAVLLALVLLVSELGEFLSLGVDTQRRKTQLPVTLDITFPALPCAVLNLELMDMAGAHEWGEEDGVAKTRLDSSGHIIGPFEPAADQNALLNLFGSASAQLLRMSGLFQVAGPEAMHAMQEALDAREGCRLKGSLPIPRVAGDFHFSVNSQSIYMMRQPERPQLNISHTIHRLRFGARIPGSTNPLDDFVRIVESGKASGSYKYFLKLVPTQYRRLGGKVLEAHQYSVTEYFTALKATDMASPAVFFSYDFSPVMLTITEQRRPLLHFLTRVCAVVGGVFAMAGLLSKLL